MSDVWVSMSERMPTEDKKFFDITVYEPEFTAEPFIIYGCWWSREHKCFIDQMGSSKKADDRFDSCNIIAWRECNTTAAPIPEGIT